VETGPGVAFCPKTRILIHVNKDALAKRPKFFGKQDFGRMIRQWHLPCMQLKAAQFNGNNAQLRLFSERRKIMEWTAPKFEEVALNCEINSYASAAL
jgi:coenzyme PQQ precursor peptide PqqA